MAKLVQDLTMYFLHTRRKNFENVLKIRIWACQCHRKLRKNRKSASARPLSCCPRNSFQPFTHATKRAVPLWGIRDIYVPRAFLLRVYLFHALQIHISTSQTSWPQPKVYEIIILKIWKPWESQNFETSINMYQYRNIKLQSFQEFHWK